MYSNNDELGRSMVEMLGVLAVIGILSIAGISSFKIALAKLKANDAAQQVSMASIEITAASMMGNQANTSVVFPEDSLVSLEDANEYKNAGIKVNFGDDVTACKQFIQMYQNNSDFYVKADCTE